MEFDWNPAKCSKNIADRGIDFADVLVGFIDPARKVVRDDRKDYGEVRYNMLAKVSGRVFHITFTERGRILWIISARKGSSGAMNKVKSRAVLVDGRPYQKKADGTLVPLKGKTDWKRLDRQTSVQTDAIAMKDRDGRPMTDEEWASAEIIHPRKVAVGMKLDNDVLGWFKSQGKGYQTRINTMLRRYYEAHRKAG
jgi:uncharacterized DUF497 family protein/uncharacterized protein (DUF4415 family)